jgi:hypothetical protein
MTGQPFTRCATMIVDVAPTESALYFPPLKTFKASPPCFFANATNSQPTPDTIPYLDTCLRRGAR